MKYEYSKQKSRKEIVTKVEEKKSSEDDDTLVDLIKIFQNLQNKLSIMNEFYEKKVEDETIDEIMKKQIEEIMTDKYISIEKAREDFKQKNE